MSALVLSLAFSTPARGGGESRFAEGKALRRRLNASSCNASSKNAQLMCERRILSWCYGIRRRNSAGLWGKATRVQVSAVAEEEGGRILLSDVVVKKKRKPFLLELREWSLGDIGAAGTVFGMHALCLLAPFTFTWKAFGVFAVLYVVTGLLGITLSYHRNLSHRSFRLPKWLEYLFAYCGVQAVQGDPLDWVSTHRYHHEYCDSVKDPHSPNEGFWYSHMSWMFDEKTMFDRVGTRNNVSDLEMQPFYRFIRDTYIIHPIAMGLLLYALGGPPFVIWGMAVRIVWVYHITWLVNSAAHVWGYQAWNTGDLSRNNWWVAALAFGEGWHNNHHAFQYSARHGLEWWQFDPTWYVIKILEALGLAKDVRAPLEQHKTRMSSKPGL
uniref:Desaturase delta 9 n=1 Tax=Picea glauca TaxID=3330 RepID=Q8S4Q3_PICGL|nr:desaturase delta 9 [Picea glauca]